MNFKVKKYFSILLTVTSFTVFADDQQAKNNLLSQMSQSNSNGGGLVNNNVLYNSQAENNQSQSGNNIAVSSGLLSTQNQSNYLNSQNNIATVNQSTVKKKTVKKQVKKKTVAKKPASDDSTTRIDISFNGDVSRLPALISEYFPDLKPMSALGRASEYNVSFDLSGVTIDEISGIVQSLTSGYVKLIYNPNNNSIRLNYSSVSNKSADPNKDSISLSDKWRKGYSKPKPIETEDGVLLFPYGNYQPILTCKPQQVCDIQFEQGEIIIDAVMGDTERWIVSGLVSGTGNKKVRHIVLKPKYPDLSTNLIVTTNKGRTYNLKLVSTEKAYLNSIGFYYPQSNIENPLNINNVIPSARNVSGNSDNQQYLSQGDNYAIKNNYANPSNSGANFTADGTKLNSTPSQTAGMMSDEDTLPALNLDFRYKVSGDDVVWKPVRVFNDGQKTFIEIPIKAMNYPSPSFTVYDSYSGQYELKNYMQKGNYFIVNGLFDNGQLIYNVGRNQLRVKIEYKPNETENKNWLY